MVSFELGKEMEKDAFLLDEKIDTADPSYMQDAGHMNLVINLAHCRVSVVDHRSAESEGLRFDFSWGLGIFSLSHARDKTKSIFQ